MAFTLIWGTGFETGTLGSIEKVEWVAPWQITAGGIGGNYAAYAYAMYWGQGEYYYRHVLTVPLSEFYFGIHWHPCNNDLNDRIRFYIGSSYIDIRHRNGTGGLVYYDISVGGSQVAYGAEIVHATRHIQVHVVIADSPNGVVEIRIDGQPYLTYNGDTKPGAETTVTKVGFRSTEGEWNYWWIDNMYIGTGGWGQEIKFTKLIPSADTATIQWDCSTGGDHRALVDEVPASDSDYIYSNTDGEKDLFDAGDFDATDKIIVGVILHTRAYKDVSGLNEVIPIVKSGGTEYPQANRVLDTTAYTYVDIFDNNPADSAEWEDADLDALIIGVENHIP